MYKLFLIFILLCLLVTPSQDILLSGRIIDGSVGLPNAIVNLKLDSIDISVLTDPFGNYNIVNVIDTVDTIPTSILKNKNLNKPILYDGLSKFGFVRNENGQMKIYDVSGKYIKDVELSIEKIDNKKSEPLKKKSTIAKITVSKEGYSTIINYIDVYAENKNFVLPKNGVFTFISSVARSGGKRKIARTVTDGVTSTVTFLTDTPQQDFKPGISSDGTKIVFFRAYETFGNNWSLWNSTICTMDFDGSNVREVIDHKFMNTEPYWTRNGSDKVTWTRMIDKSEGTEGSFPYITDFDGDFGEEKSITNSNNTWLGSSLKDGSVFIKKLLKYYLIKEQYGELNYRQIDYPDSPHHLHKVTISNDETKIAYMKKVILDGDDYKGAEIILADFDASVPAITNEVVAVPLDTTTHAWYVSISQDNKYLIYAQDGAVWLYDVEEKTRKKITTRPDLEYAYPTFVGSVK